MVMGDVEAHTAGGRLFHACGAATENAQNTERQTCVEQLELKLMMNEDDCGPLCQLTDRCTQRGKTVPCR